jgi:hypothetical protein
LAQKKQRVGSNRDDGVEDGKRMLGPADGVPEVSPLGPSERMGANYGAADVSNKLGPVDGNAEEALGSKLADGVDDGRRILGTADGGPHFLFCAWHTAFIASGEKSTRKPKVRRNSSIVSADVDCIYYFYYKQ